MMSHLLYILRRQQQQRALLPPPVHIVCDSSRVAVVIAEHTERGLRLVGRQDASGAALVSLTFTFATKGE